jgi:hypothetical protein
VKSRDSASAHLRLRLWMGRVHQIFFATLDAFRRYVTKEILGSSNPGPKGEISSYISRPIIAGASSARLFLTEKVNNLELWSEACPWPSPAPSQSNQSATSDRSGTGMGLNIMLPPIPRLEGELGGLVGLPTANIRPGCCRHRGGVKEMSVWYLSGTYHRANRNNVF